MPIAVPPQSALTFRAVNLRVIALLCATTTACGSAQVQPVAPAPSLRPADALSQARTLERAGKPAEALAIAERAAEPWPAELRALVVRSAWTLGKIPQAQIQGQRLANAVQQGQAPAADAQLDLARWHLRAKRTDAAFQALVPLAPCRTPAVCRLASTVVLANPTPMLLNPRALQLAPPQGTPRRSAWLQDLAFDLARADHLTEARTLLEAARRADPADVALWNATWQLARRVPEPQARTQWLNDLQNAQLPAATLALLGTSPEPPREAPVAAAILGLAAHRPDATEVHWQLWATALGRAGDKAALETLALGPERSHFTTELSQMVLARQLLAVKLPEVALPLLRQLPATEPLVMALEADLLRQRGMMPEARAKAAAAVATGPDRSGAAYLLSELWRAASLLSDADRWLAQAAESPGVCQLAAARAKAMRVAGPARPNAATTAAVLQYARLLATAPAQPSCVLSEQFEPPPAWAREQLVRQIEPRDAWRDVTVQVLRLFTEAGVAEGAMWRALATRRLQDGSVEDFLRLDQRARTEADRSGEVLQNDRVLSELAGRPQATLVRWLRDTGVREADEPQVAWRVATALLTGSFAGLGRRWAEQALAATPDADATRVPVAVLIAGGAADLALEILRDKVPADASQDILQAQGEVDALLRLDRATEATRRLDRLLARTDLAARQLRGVADFAHDRGLCEPVLAMAPRLVADPDPYVLRAGVKTTLDCARRLQREDAAAAIVQAVQNGAPDPGRLEVTARELVQNGFDALAVALFDQLEKIRPMSDDALQARARALLDLGRTAEAGQMLRRVTQIVGRGRRASPFLYAAELLENHGQLAVAATFWQGAVAADPDTPLLRVRLIGNALRLGVTDDLASQLQSLFKSGPSADDLRALAGYADRCGATRRVHDALAAVADPDRELERFRLELAAQLGLREVVEAGVRRLRAKGSVPPARAPEWLLQVGAHREAREVTTDVLTAPEPSGDARERVSTLELALDRQRDPSSAEESLSLARLYVGRALDTATAAVQAAGVLASRGLAREALAVASLAGAPDGAGRLCMQGQIQMDTGDRKAALLSWRKAMATLLLDPRLREWLKNASRLPREYDFSDLGRDFRCVHESLRGAGEQAALAAWLTEVRTIAPDSSLLRVALIQALLEQGKVHDAALALEDAARTLPEFRRDDFGWLADRVLREGGGPDLLRWFLSDGETLRTEPWLVAFADAVLTILSPAVDQRAAALAMPIDGPVAVADRAGPDLAAKVADLRDWLATLSAGMPEVRVALALQWAGRGQGERAVRALGTSPLVFLLDRQEKVREVVQAVAAALIAASGGTGGVQAAKATADRWVRTGLGTDATAVLAAELVRQGLPELAKHVLKPQPEGLGEPTQDRQRARLYVVLATGTDDDVATEAMHNLRGRRASLLNIDELYVHLLRSGRITAARRVAAMLLAEEPGLRPPALLDPQPPTPDGELPALEQFRPDAVAWLHNASTDLPEEVADAAQRLATAVDPLLAERWAEARAARSDEAWHAWQSLLQAAVSFERLDLARTALQHAATARAPAGMLACPRLGLERTGTLAGCLRGRPLDAVPTGELADVATGIAQAVDVPGEATVLQALVQGPLQARAHFVEAAASRLWALDAGQKHKLGQFVRALHDALPLARRDAFAVNSMDELAALGLGDLGVAVTERAFRFDPDGRGQRNNLAYARFLAGHDARDILQLARPAAFDGGGEPAYASLDTLGALAWAAGDPHEALLLQRRALASSIVQPDDLLRRALASRGSEFADAYQLLSGPGVGLPLVRLAEFLLHDGALEDARLLAAQVLLLRPEDAPTTQRARRVLRASLETPRK
jgi:tetratricopeptide (TPR) repeat protein